MIAAIEVFFASAYTAFPFIFAATPFITEMYCDLMPLPVAGYFCSTPVTAVATVLLDWRRPPLTITLYSAVGQNSSQPKSDYHFCDQGKLGIPYRHELKLSGTYRLPW